MRLTKRDIEILKFVNASGFCNAPQLGRRFSINWWRVYKIMKRLRCAGLVEHKRLYFDQHGIFYLTNKGAKFSDLPTLDGISKGTYDHQLCLVNVVIKLIERYPEVKWISERHLKQQHFYYGIGKRGHIADGLLIFPGEKTIAIEVELSLKSKQRLEKIFHAYGAQLAIEEVWYFCAEEIIQPLTVLSTKKSYIKIHSLKEFLG